MMTFSTSSATCASLPVSLRGVTLLCIVYSLGRRWLRLRDRGRPPAALTLALFPPAGHGTPQLEEGDRSRDRRKPERERAVRQHGDDREPVVDAEADERPDHPAVDPADPAGQRQQVAEHADEGSH